MARTRQTARPGANQPAGRSHIRVLNARMVRLPPAPAPVVIAHGPLSGFRVTPSISQLVRELRLKAAQQTPSNQLVAPVVVEQVYANLFNQHKQRFIQFVKDNAPFHAQPDDKDGLPRVYVPANDETARQAFDALLPELQPLAE